MSTESPIVFTGDAVCPFRYESKPRIRALSDALCEAAAQSEPQAWRGW